MYFSTDLIKSQYSRNTDQSIHDVFAGIRAHRCVFVSIERVLICIWILTVCISTQSQYNRNTDQSIHAGIRAYGCVFVSMERDLICIWILTVCISVQTLHRVNTDQSIHDVFAVPVSPAPGPRAPLPSLSEADPSRSQVGVRFLVPRCLRPGPHSGP